MTLSAEIKRFATMENVSLAVPMIITASRVKNVIVSPVFLLVKMEKFVQQALTVILMIESAFHSVNLIKTVTVDTNAPMVIVSNLAELRINAQIVNNIVTSKHKTSYKSIRL